MIKLNCFLISILRGNTIFDLLNFDFEPQNKLTENCLVRKKPAENDQL